DQVGHPVTQCIIHKAVARHGPKPVEAGGHDPDREMAGASGGAGMADMAMAVVDDVDCAIRKIASQPVEDLVPGRLHWLVSSAWRPIQTAWAMMNTTIRMSAPNSLSCTQKSVVNEYATMMLRTTMQAKYPAHPQLRLLLTASGRRT